MKLVTVAEMQAIEREADSKGLTYERMMEHAGMGLARVVDEVYGAWREAGALGLVGSGNNGGDTLVALAWLADRGWKTSAYIVKARPQEDALLARLRERGGQVYSVADDPGFGKLEKLILEHAILLDGVLGTGIRLPLKSEIAGVLRVVINTLEKTEDPPRVVAVDCPSGVDSDSGEAAPETIPADLTVTMAAVKRGLLAFPANSLVGEMRLVGIGLESENLTVESWEKVKRRVAAFETVRAILPPRPPDAHKGTFGTALLVAGSLNYTGAALLAGKAAFRAGTGLVKLAVPAPLHAALAGHFPESTWVLLPHQDGFIAAQAADEIFANLERVTAILLGPGFGLEHATEEFLRRLLGAASLDESPDPGSTPPTDSKRRSKDLPPLIIDADGLKLLARMPGWPGLLPAPAILTPHPGEMAILTGKPVAQIQADRLGMAERYAQEWGHVLVLKGAQTVVASPDGQVTVIPVATAALARAGTGDVLAGILTGLRAQGVEAYLASVAGCWIHAQAGLSAAKRLGSSAAVLAGDVLSAVIEVMSELQPYRSRPG